MSTFDLKLLQTSATYELQENRYFLNYDSSMWSMFKKNSRAVCDNLINLASASLLLDMKVSLFQQNLCRSAENWRCYLYSSKHFFGEAPTLGYTSPLYGAIVAGDTTLLKSLAAVLPNKWVEQTCYEDSFHITLLHYLLSINGCKVDEAVNEHLSSLADCASDALVVDLFKSLLGLDDLTELDFWANFESALLAREDHVDLMVANIATKVTQFGAHRYIWFEGLVWLKLAKQKGFTIPSDAIIFCPDEAIACRPVMYAGDWKVIPILDTLSRI